MSAIAEGTHVFDAGDVPLESGETLPDAHLTYTVHGCLSAERDNAIVLPTFYGGTHSDVTYLIGPDRALDPDRWCVIVPDMFGNGVSSSPSTGPAPFPAVGIRDNVSVQHRLVTEVLGISELALVVGFSMGGQQAYEWAAGHPAMVRRLAVLCSAARTAPHTWVFLDGLAASLLAAGEPDGPDRGRATVGKRALGRVWAGWGLSQAWYRERRFEMEGYDTVEAYVHACWEPSFDDWDTRDLLCMLRTWQAHGVGGPGAGRAEFEAAMRGITAASLVMPGATDLYFPPEDSADEVALLRHGRLVVIPSVFGHGAGGDEDHAALALIKREIRRLLDAEPPPR